jgi:hypothetical protein
MHTIAEVVQEFHRENPVFHDRRFGHTWVLGIDLTIDKIMRSNHRLRRVSSYRCADCLSLGDTCILPKGFSVPLQPKWKDIDGLQNFVYEGVGYILFPQFACIDIEDICVRAVYNQPVMYLDQKTCEQRTAAMRSHRWIVDDHDVFICEDCLIRSADQPYCFDSCGKRLMNEALT